MRFSRVKRVMDGFHACTLNNAGTVGGHFYSCFSPDGRSVPALWRLDDEHASPAEGFPELCQGETWSMLGETLCGLLQTEGFEREVADPYPAAFVLEPDGTFFQLDPPEGRVDSVYLGRKDLAAGTVLMSTEHFGESADEFFWKNPQNRLGWSPPYRVPFAARWALSSGVWNLEPLELPSELVEELLTDVHGASAVPPDEIAAGEGRPLSWVAGTDNQGRFLVNVIRQNGTWCPLIWHPNGSVERAIQAESLDTVSLLHGLNLTDTGDFFAQDAGTEGPATAPNYYLRVSPEGDVQNLPTLGTGGLCIPAHDLVVSKSGKFFTLRAPFRAVAGQSHPPVVPDFTGRVSRDIELWVRNEGGDYGPPITIDPCLEEGVDMARVVAISDNRYMLIEITNYQTTTFQLNRFEM